MSEKDAPEQDVPEQNGEMPDAGPPTEAVDRTEPDAATGPDVVTGGTAEHPEPDVTTGPATEPGAARKDEADGENGTEAVVFDPFADDDDEEEFDLADLGDLSDLIEPGSTAQGRSQADVPTSATEVGCSTSGATTDPVKVDSGERSRREALSTFRELRGAAREGKNVADGMVHLPFITPPVPEEAIIDPSDAIAKGIDPPTLKAGDLIAGQYEILGPIAHGGLGWIYIATDHNVANRYVVLKGLMATENEHERAVADSERAFLADITHPGIVKIFNFIDDPRSPGGFIVMEFVGGPSLRERRREFPDNTLPVDIAIGYMLEVLPALDYLHSRGVVYNDLKPDNIIITEDQVKLIDLGAVSGIGAYGHIFGTKGFQAPEIASTGPTVASDIYTVGRTLASLVVNLPITDGAYDPELPTPEEEPLFQRYMSLYRLLLRATDPDPNKRFSSAVTLANQMVGVLREVLAIRDRVQHAHLDTRFTAQRSTYGTKHMLFRTDQLIDGIPRSVQIAASEVIAALPLPLTDPSDPGASLLSAARYTEPGEVLDTLESAAKQPQMSSSVEIPLTMVRAWLDMGQAQKAQDKLDEVQDWLGDDWRFRWLSGVAALLRSDFVTAQYHFNEVLYLLPGEPAPKLALAATNELLMQQQGVNTTKLLDDETAQLGAMLSYAYRTPITEDVKVPPARHLSQEPATLRMQTMRLYGLVWATNPTTVSSAFGLARQLTAEGLVDAAVGVLDRVPQASRHHRLARLTSILMLISDRSRLSESRIRRAARRLEIMPTNEPRMQQVRLAVMLAGLNWIYINKKKGNDVSSESPLFDVPFTERGLRLGLEQGLRMLARQAQFDLHRFRLVDMANMIRPRTWF